MSTVVPDPAQAWKVESYIANAGFVPELGLPVLQLLNPRPGERILDLGCGDGTLTAKLREHGCVVVGVDSSPEMVEGARTRGLDARLIDGHALAFEREFDAVFSNAALHWMKTDPQAVVTGVARALRPGGRFVGELGGHGNVAAVVVALNAVLQQRGVDTVSPWYFPSLDAYRGVLERARFTVRQIELIPRPTPLPTGMAGWLATFADPFLKRLPGGDRADAVAEVLELLRPALCDERGRWTADYVRLRFAADLV